MKGKGDLFEFESKNKKNLCIVDFNNGSELKYISKYLNVFAILHFGKAVGFINFVHKSMQTPNVLMNNGSFIIVFALEKMRNSIVEKNNGHLFLNFTHIFIVFALEQIDFTIFFLFTAVFINKFATALIVQAAI